MNLLFSGLMYAFLGVFLVICLLGAAVIAIGIKDAARNHRILVQAQKNHRRKVMARNLMEIKRGGKK